MSEKKLTGDLNQLSYALGMSIAGNLIQSGVKTIHAESFASAIQDAFTGAEPKLQPQEANQIIEHFLNEVNNEQGAGNSEEGKKFLEENGKKKGVIVLPSGLQYEVINEGDGEIPTLSDQVKCHYHGTLIDGTIFDSSVQRGKPAVFPVNGVIKGWVEALQLMSAGSKWRLYVPSDLAYGKQGAGGVIGPNTTLIFDVELLEII
ncbi:MAG: FKBP-type peptidyl-prolyl cis-trans isomerase [Prolixibacteraceae bacterium]|nr:FKBP-type peptidyl-prolyl cis-trans isomerase [Prolixibacteraceae bacterium]